MIIDYTTKEIINKYVNEIVPGGIHGLYHVNSRKHIKQIIEIFIRKNIINNKEITIKHICLDWEFFLYRKFSILN
jgi:hypothetical protein